MNVILAQTAAPESAPMPWIFWLFCPILIIMGCAYLLRKLRKFRGRIRPAAEQAQWLAEQFDGQMTVYLNANETRFKPAELAGIAYQHGFVFGYGYRMNRSITRTYKFNRVYYPARDPDHTRHTTTETFRS